MKPERWQKVEQLYNDALEHEASQRGAFLARACRGDEELRREVESLLAQGKTADSFLEASPLGVAAEMFAKHQVQSFIGRQMGSYQIVCLLGTGGMGEVYEARDTKLGRNVAIKILPAEDLHARITIRSSIRANERVEGHKLKIAIINPDRNVYLRFSRLVEGTVKYYESRLQGISLNEMVDSG